jgi:stage V sporulation protein G
MPSKKRKNGTFRDIAHPLNNETRRKIEDRVLEKYREITGRGSTPDARADDSAGSNTGAGDLEFPDDRTPA